MAKYTVTISEMSAAASDFMNQAENFRQTAEQMLNASRELTQTGWRDDASEIFLEKMNELNAWCDTMSGYINEFSQALTKIASEYEHVDEYSASQFQR